MTTIDTTLECLKSEVQFNGKNKNKINEITCDKTAEMARNRAKASGASFSHFGNVDQPAKALPSVTAFDFMKEIFNKLEMLYGVGLRVDPEDLKITYHREESKVYTSMSNFDNMYPDQAILLLEQIVSLIEDDPNNPFGEQKMMDQFEKFKLADANADAGY
jgi:hypothetical protein